MWCDLLLRPAAQEEGYRGDSDVWRELLLRPAARDGVCRGDLPLHPVTRKGGGREGDRRYWEDEQIGCQKRQHVGGL